MKQLSTIIITGLLLVAGCSPVPPGFVKKQTIKYKQTDITGVSKEKVDADVIFREVNRDSVTLDNVSLDYELFIEGQKFAAGRDLKFNFKANDTTDFAVPIEVKYLDFFKTAENMTKAVIEGRRTIEFELKTLVTIRVSPFSFTIPVTAEGELPLQEDKKPQIKIKL
jgi:LEA14-like dessication related protein